MMPHPRRKWLATAALALATLAAANLLARHHARAMLRYAPPADTRTRPPERLAGAAKLRVLLRGVCLPRPFSPLGPDSLSPDAQAIAIDVPDGAVLSAWLAARGPDAPLAILFHGYSTDKTRLLPEARALLDLGCSVLLVDFRGSGGSSEAYATLGILEARDVLASIHRARSEIPHSRLLLYGQSMGAAAILRAIRHHGADPDAIVLEAAFDTMLNAIRHRFRAMRLPSFPAATLLAFWGGREFGFNAFAHKPAADAAAVACPALFLHGADDPRAPPADARRVFDAVPGPKTFLLFDGVGHGSILARHPAPWRQAMRALLEIHPENAP